MLYTMSMAEYVVIDWATSKDGFEGLDQGLFFPLAGALFEVTRCGGLGTSSRMGTDFSGLIWFLV